MMSRLRNLVFIAFWIGAFGYLASAQAQPTSQVSNLQAFQRSGQTFLTWNEIAATGVTYRVYRSSAPITSTGQGNLLGVVNEFSSLNKRASDVKGSDTYYTIQEGGSPLGVNTGLFVYTTASNGNFYYAVTAQNGSGENKAITLGSNSLSSSLAETVALPAPVRQNAGSEQHYVLWTNFQDTPLIPAMANRPGITYNFMCDNIKPQLSQILNVGLYGGDNAYNDKVLSIHPDEFKLALDNPRPDLFAPPYSNQEDEVNPINTCWYGYGTDFTAQQVLTSGTVPNYTQRYMIYVIKWVLTNWPNVDKNRVYLTGSSFGGMGSVSTGFAFPNLFAAIWSKVPRFDLGGTEWDLEKDSNVTDRYQTIWGTTERNLPTPNISATYPDYAASSEGYNVYDRMDALQVVAQNPGKDLPVLITAAGKQDSHVGWNEKPRFINAMQTAHQPLFFYWENTGHKFETTIFDDNFRRAELLKYRLNRSHVAVTNLSINNDPGQGNDLLPGGTVTGESRGTINGYVDWDSNTIIDTPSEYRVKVLLRGTLMDQVPALAGVQSATATLTPRRLQSFPRQANSSYSWENRRASDNALLASGNINSDSNGLVHVNNFEISRTGNLLVLRKVSGPPSNQSPTAVATASPISGAAPLNVQFNGAGSSDPDGTLTNYNWNFGDGSTSTQINPQHTFNSNGTYNVTLTVTDNGGATGSASLQINAGSSNAPPTAVATASPTSGAAPLSVQFNGAGSSDPDGTLTNYNWNFGDGSTSTQINPQHTFNSNGAYNVTLIVTDNGGATGTASLQINAGSSNTPPTAVASASPDSGGVPLTVLFIGSNSFDSDGTLSSFYWNFGDNRISTSINPQHTYTSNGVYFASLVITDNGGATDTATVRVKVGNSNARPTAVASAAPTAGKAPLNVQFSSNGSSDSDGTITSYSWSFGNGNTSTLPNPTHSYGIAGNYTATLIVTDNSGGKDTAAVAISVTSNARPTAVASATPTAGKAPLNVQFSSNGSSDSDGTITSYSWNFGNGSSSTLPNPAHSYGIAGNYTATLIVTDNNGGKDTAAVAISVTSNARPTAIASATPNGGKAPLNVQFSSNGSSDSDGTITSYSWNFGNGNTSALANPTHSYNNLGNYTATLIVTDNDGGKDTAAVAITVTSNTKPTAVASATPNSGNVPLDVQFSSAGSTDSDGSIMSYSWNFGNGRGSTLPNPTQTYDSDSEYTATLIVTDNDGDADTATVAVQVIALNTPPVAVATATPDSGVAPLAVQLNSDGSSDSDGTIIAYFWTFGDGSTSNLPNPQHSYGASGTYHAKLQVTDDGGATATDSVVIKVSQPLPQRPKAVATANVTSGPVPLTVQFTGSASFDPDGVIKTYRWKYRDGTTDNVPDPAHTFQSPGSYNVRLIVYDSDSMSDSAWVEINATGVLQRPKAIAKANVLTGKAPLSVQFTGSTSSDADGTIRTYRWKFRDGTTDNVPDPLHTFQSPGLYKVRLIVIDNDDLRDSSWVRITVTDTDPLPPKAVTSADVTFGRAPLTVRFKGSDSYDPDGAIKTYRWKFRDGTTDNVPDPLHIFQLPGEYNVRLIVYDNDDFTDSSWVSITVADSGANQRPTAAIAAAPDSGVAPLAVQFSGASSHDPDGVLVSWQWNFGDGATGNGASSQHIYATPGLYIASLFVSDNDGGSDTAHAIIRVTAPQPPVARATASPQNGVAPLQVQFNGAASSDADGSITAYWWDFGDGGNSNSASPSHVYSAAGSFTATLIVTDTQTLRDTATVAITVTNTALPSFRVNCAGPAYTAANGRLFAADQEYKVFAPSPWGYLDDGSTQATSDPIANTSDPVLYQTQHTKGVLEYRFDLANGAYEVTLHFAEIRDDEAGFRVMDVYAENQVVVDDLDPFVAAGGKNIALTRRLANIVVNDGQLNVRFEKANSEVRRNIAIAAIEVVPAGNLTKAGADMPEAALPAEYALAQNYPNPFNPVTHIAFSLPESGHVQLRFYNALGQPVRKAIERHYDAGHHTVRVNAASWPSGLYFYELQVNGFRAMRKMIVAK